MKAQGYCVKCKAKKAMADAAESLLKNGRKAIKGKCPTCGTGMFKILGGKSSPPSSDSTSAAPPGGQAKPPGFRLTFFHN